MSLQEKVAIVAGGARGIGAGIVRCLSEEGAIVVFNYVSSSSRIVAKTVVQELAQEKREAFAVQADMTDLSAPGTIVKATLFAFNVTQIDILVNNAGIGDVRPLDEVTLDNYNRIMDINLREVVFMTQAVLPYLPRGGRIVNVSSISRGGYATQSAYAASKAAVEALTRVGDRARRPAASEEVQARLAEQHKTVPAGQRCGTAQDIGDIVVFLAGERSRWVTGDVICAHGGILYL